MRYKLEGDTLVFYNAAGKPALPFAKVTP